MSLTASELRGHDPWALERFKGDTQHMIEFEVLTGGGFKGRRRLYLSQEGYARALAAQQEHQIQIKRHARVVEGHILYDHRRKRKR